jgi:Family of unknown function (DUF6079)
VGGVAQGHRAACRARRSHVQPGVSLHCTAAQARISELIFWGRPILSEQEQKDWKDRLGSLKGFLESLQPFNTSGKLKNFPHDSAAVLGQKPALDLSRELDELARSLTADKSANLLPRES